MENGSRSSRANFLSILTILECLQNNDPDGVMEIIAIYLEALNKAKLRQEANLPRSTLYSTLKHRNPTIKTLAKFGKIQEHLLLYATCKFFLWKNLHVK